ncbi:MAG: putative Ig domain-containing protein [Pseudomonadota bacterium]
MKRKWVRSILTACVMLFGVTLEANAAANLVLYSAGNYNKKETFYVSVQLAITGTTASPSYQAAQFDITFPADLVEAGSAVAAQALKDSTGGSAFKVFSSVTSVGLRIVIVPEQTNGGSWYFAPGPLVTIPFRVKDSLAILASTPLDIKLADSGFTFVSTSGGVLERPVLDNTNHYSVFALGFQVCRDLLNATFNVQNGFIPGASYKKDINRDGICDDAAIAGGKDSDGDGITDKLELSYGLNPYDPTDALADYDGDGKTNKYAIEHSLNPYGTQLTNLAAIFDSSLFAVGGTQSKPGGTGDTTGTVVAVTPASYDPLGPNGSSFAYVRTIGNAYGVADGADAVLSSVVDNAGNFFIVGTYRYTVDFSGGGVDPKVSGQSNNAFVTKTNVDGTHAWSWTAASDSLGVAADIKVDTNGNAIVVGYFSGTADFGGVSLSAQGTSAFVVKLNSNGKLIWVRQIDDASGNGAERINAVSLDRLGNVYVVGTTDATQVDFDPTAGLDVRDKIGLVDLFVSRLNTDGSYAWTYRAGDIDGIAQGISLSVSGDGHVFFAGQFQGSVDFGLPSGNIKRVSIGRTYDGFVASLNSSGTFGWVWTINDAGNGIVKYLRADETGVNLLGAVEDSATVDFNPLGTSPLTQGVAGLQGYLAHLDMSGAANSVKFTHPGATQFNYDMHGNLYVVGSFTGAYDFDPTAYVDAHGSMGGEDVFLSKMLVDGTYVWTRVFGGVGDDKGVSLGIDGDAKIFIAGTFQNSVDFSSANGASVRRSLGAEDIFVTLLALNPTNYIDSDGDTLADVLEDRIGMDKHNGLDVNGDKDGDGIPNYVEFLAGTFNTGVNHAPVLTLVANQNVSEGNKLTFSVSATDQDDTTPSVTVDGLPYGSTFIDSNFSWAPTFDQAGSYSLIFTASDGNLSASQTVVITVANINRAPTIAAISSKSVSEGALLSFAVAASDPDGTTPTITATGLPTGAELSGNTFTWMPNYSQSGSYTVTFTATDGTLSASQVITIAVNDVNRAPVLTPVGNKSVSEGTYMVFSVSGSDPDGDSVTYSALNLPIGATFSYGIFSWLPNYVQGGVAYPVTITATDSRGASVSENITITVNDVATVPTAGVSQAYAWVRNLPANAAITVTKSVTDSKGNTYVSGYFRGTYDFDFGPGVDTKSNAGADAAFVTKINSDGTYGWTWWAGNNWYTVRAKSLAVDASGNVVIAGIFSGSTDFNPSAVAADAFYGTGWSTFVTKLDTNGGYGWTRVLKAGYNDATAEGLTVDSAGNIYLAGHYAGASSQLLHYTTDSSYQSLATINGIRDGYLVKWNGAGAYQWARTYGNPYGTVYAYDVAVDDASKVYVAGAYSTSTAGGTVNFNIGGATADNRVVNGTQNAFVSAASASNGYLWTWTPVASSTTGYTLSNMLISAGDGVLIKSAYSPGATFDNRVPAVEGVLSTATLPNALTRLLGTGSYGGTMLINTATQLRKDTGGNVYLAGAFSGTTDLNPMAGTDNRTAAGGNDAYITKLLPDLSYGWSKTFGGTGNDSVAALSINSLGDLYVSGYFGGTVDFDPDTPVANRTAATYQDTYTLLLTTDVAGKKDSDGDTLSDQIEIANGLNPNDATDAGGDLDGDGLNNLREYQLGTNMRNADSDGDGIDDKYEATTYRFNALNAADAMLDFDRDGVTNLAEYRNGADANFASAPGNFTYAKSLSGVGASLPYIDRNHNKYAITPFNGWNIVDLDPGPDTVARSSSYTSGAVTKFKPDGTYAWSWDLGITQGNNGVTGIAVDSIGNVFITGYFVGTQDFNPGVGVDSRTSTSYTYDAFVTKVGAQGNYLWTRTFGGTGSEFALGIALDASDNLYLAGQFSGTADFDPNVGVSNLTAAGYTDAYLAKWDSNGNLLWARNMGASGRYTGGNVTNNYEPWNVMQIRYASGKVYLVLQSDTNIDFDTTQTGGEFNGSGYFVAAYDATSGAYQWAQLRPDQTVAPKLGVDAQGNVLLASYYGGGVTKLSNTGALVWSKTLAGSGSGIYSGVYIKGLSVDAQGNLYVGGFFDMNVDFNPDAALTDIRTPNATDGFITKLWADGVYGWTNVITGTERQYVSALASGTNGDLLANVESYAAVDMDPGAGVAVRTTWVTHVLFATDPTIAGDRDNDGIPDAYESLHGLPVTVDNGLTDLDGDGLSDYQEYMRGTDPQQKDTDGDGMHDYYEVVTGLNPLDRLDSSGDINGNGIANLAEYQASPATYTVTRMAGVSTCNVMRSALAADGTLYLVGFTGQASTTAMKACVVAMGSDHKQKWRYDSTNYLSNYKDIALDGQGNVYATGRADSAGRITKLNSSGNVVWDYGFYSNLESDAVGVDASGNVYLLQHLYGYSTNIDFDPGAGVVNLTKYGLGDMVITKLDSTGAHVWSKNFGAAGGYTTGQRIRVTNGKITIAGTFSVAADFDPTATGGEATTTGVSDADRFVAQYDAVTGAYQWSDIAGNTLDEFNVGISDLAVDSVGNVIVTGGYQGTVNFNRAGNDSRTAVGGKDIYVTKLSATGAYQWTYAIGSAGDDISGALVTDMHGDVTVAGQMAAAMDFNASPTVADTKGSYDDAYLLRLSASGGYQGSELLGLPVKPQALLQESATRYSIAGYYPYLSVAPLDMDTGPGRQETIWSSGGFIIRREVLTR